MKRIVIVVLLLSFCCAVNSCFLFNASPKKMRRLALKAHPSFDVAIVPGIQFVEPAWNRVLQLRLLWVKYLYDKGLVKNIITSGSSVYTPYVEGAIMAKYLVAMGVPRDKIIVEDRAQHSTENLWYGYKLAKKKGFTSIVFCSDPFQSKLLYRFANKRTKKEVYFLPASIDTVRKLAQDTPVINYKPLRIDDFVPITQKYNRHQRFRGTMGKNINFKESD